MPQGSGSGFVWDKQGHIVTNYHVIRGASDLRFVRSFLFFSFTCLSTLSLFWMVFCNNEMDLFDCFKKWDWNTSILGPCHFAFWNGDVLL